MSRERFFERFQVVTTVQLLTNLGKLSSQMTVYVRDRPHTTTLWGGGARLRHVLKLSGVLGHVGGREG